MTLCSVPEISIVAVCACILCSTITCKRKEYALWDYACLPYMVMLTNSMFLLTTYLHSLLVCTHNHKTSDKYYS